MKQRNVGYKKVDAAIFSHKAWVAITDPEKLRSLGGQLLSQSGFCVVAFDEHHFEQEGYTCFWLLAESHLAIHSFPLAGKSYVELSSCNASKKEVFRKLLENDNIQAGI